jgi:hypothetical protein
MTNSARSPLVEALLSDAPPSPRSEPGPARRHEPRASTATPPELTIYVGAATADGDPRFKLRGPAASVALLDHPLRRRAVAVKHESANVYTAAIVAAAAGADALKRPCRVRVVTDCHFLRYAMTGQSRRTGYDEDFGQLEQVLRAGRHTVEYQDVSSERDRALLEAAHAAARLLARGELDEAAAAAECASLAAQAEHEPAAPPRRQQPRPDAADRGRFKVFAPLSALLRAGGRRDAPKHAT